MGCAGSKAAVKNPDLPQEGKGELDRDRVANNISQASAAHDAGAAALGSAGTENVTTGMPADAQETKTGADPSPCDVSQFSSNMGKLNENDDPLEGVNLDIPDSCEPVMMNNGVVYRGEWRNGKQHGIGEQRQSDGVVYTGQFFDGHIQGFGRLERPDGSKYEGEFVQGKAQTTTRCGKYTFADGSIYIGQWMADKRHGRGREVTFDGNIYEGEYRNGSKHGHGRMQSPSGDVYEGEFKKGDMNGQGRYCWPDGRVYEGDWSMSRMHGKGVFYFVDGRKYEGQFMNSTMEGEGKLTWPDGSSYKGGFKAGLPHGEGTHQATSETSPRLALWNQGVRVKWLDSEDPKTEKSTQKPDSDGSPKAAADATDSKDSGEPPNKEGGDAPKETNAT